MNSTLDSPATKIRLLAQTFPCLWDVHGIAPWNANALDDWGASGAPSHGELVSIRFILAVWDSRFAWRSGRFDVMEALEVWDESHRTAFLAWAREPWWP